jgi:hypothetical protein
VHDEIQTIQGPLDLIITKVDAGELRRPIHLVQRMHQQCGLQGSLLEH